MSAAAGAGSGKLIRTAIETHTFDPVYYLHGEDDILKDDAVRRLMDAAVDPATREFNLETRRGAELDAGTLGSLLATPPMMAARRMVVIRDAGALNKDARAMLDRYLDAPASDLLLVLTTPAGGKVDKALAQKATDIAFEPLTGAQVPRWITHYVEKTLGARITPKAMTLLQEAVGTDLAQLRIELDKAASFAAGGEIDDAAVEAVVGVRHGETLGDLLDAIAARDALRALELLPEVLQQPKTSAVTIVLALSTQTLAMAWGRALRDRGTSASRLEGEFFRLLKSGGSSYTGRSWGEAVRAWARHVDRWSASELDAAIETLMHADASLKDTRLSSDEQTLTNVILALCGASQRRAA